MFHKIKHVDYQETIKRCYLNFSTEEQALLNEILLRFDFNPMQEQALVQAVLQQSRFDPNLGHFDEFDDEESSTICPHCINPPAPPLRDYLMWRERN